MDEFVIPDFLKNCDIDTIHKKMLSKLPDDIDKTEGGFVWDFTRPTAMIASELLEYYAVEMLQVMFPQYSYGEYLDLIGGIVHVTRKPANHATVTLTITGEEGTLLPLGTVFCTEDDADVDSIEFATSENCTIGSSGEVSIIATAVEGGIGSNVDTGTIIMMSEPVNNVETVTNEAPATGGTDEEDDESYRERILDAMRNRDVSYIGCMGDYKRWAESVPGMGTAIIMFNWDGPETVKIVCTDANGEAANQTILDAIYELIMSPSDPLQRLAPPNTILTVVAPTFIDIDYSFDVVLEDGYTADMVVNSFKTKLNDYYKNVPTEGCIRYTAVGALLSETSGVVDYASLLINESTSNITVDEDEFPTTNSVTANVVSEV